MNKILIVSEQHRNVQIKWGAIEYEMIADEQEFYFNYPFKNEIDCYRINIADNTITTNYFIGIDWVIQDKLCIHVEPKMNDDFQIDFFKMVFESLSGIENLKHLEGLYYVDFNKSWIPIHQRNDLLSPFLIIQFLILLKKIAKKGLMKTYYSRTENLRNRIKGKILVSQQIKKNLFKNRLGHNFCNYQEFGIDNDENRFLKCILFLVEIELANFSNFFSKNQYRSFQDIISYCKPLFERVDSSIALNSDLKTYNNKFYSEYAEAIKIGNFILKKNSYKIDNKSKTFSLSPVYWIDMSKLFELWVFSKLKEIFPRNGEVTYHDRFKGLIETDILIKAEGYECVIDCKYKPQYLNNSPSLEDKRQLAGYVRMKSVYKLLGISDDKIVKGIILYSNQSSEDSFKKEDLFSQAIDEYVEFYKLGLKLPIID